MLKQSISLLIILLFLLLPGTVSAQEGTEYSALQMHHTLAQGTAQGLLMSLTQPEMNSLRDYYLLEPTTAADTISQLVGARFSSFTIDNTDWLNANSQRTMAYLNPGRQVVLIDTAWDNGRWKVRSISMPNATPAPRNQPETTSSFVAATTPATSTVQPLDNGLSGQIVFQTHSGGGIYIINADGTGLRYITHGIDPQLSPDGTQIAFTRWAPEYALYTIHVDGSNERKWATGWRQMKSPTWSADGQRLAFSYQAGGRLEDEHRQVKLFKGDRARVPAYARDVEIEDGVLEFTIPMDAYWHLQQVDLTTGEYVDTVTGSRYSYAATFHPTQADKLLFRGDSGLGLYDVNQKVTQRLTTDPNDRAAVFSPDGSKIAVSYWQHGHWDIHTLNADGSNRQRLTETPMSVIATEGRDWNNAAPMWSPDGQQLIFMTDRTGEWAVWLMNADGSEPRPMFSNGALAELSFAYAGVDERMFSWR